MGRKKPISPETRNRIQGVLGWVHSPGKRCQISYEEIRESLRSGRQIRHVFPIPNHEEIKAQLNVQGILDDSKKESLSVSVKIDGERVLGVDYNAKHGGYHKHLWTPQERDNEHIPLPSLNQRASELSSEEILQEMFKALEIELEEEGP